MCVCLSVCRQHLGDSHSINVQRIRNNITAGQIKMQSNVRLHWLGWLERPQATGRAGGKGIEAVGRAHVGYPCNLFRFEYIQPLNAEISAFKSIPYVVINFLVVKVYNVKGNFWRVSVKPRTRCLTVISSVLLLGWSVGVYVKVIECSPLSQHVVFCSAFSFILYLFVLMSV